MKRFPITVTVDPTRPSVVLFTTPESEGEMGIGAAATEEQYDHITDELASKLHEDWDLGRHGDEIVISFPNGETQTRTLGEVFDDSWVDDFYARQEQSPEEFFEAC